MKLFIKKNIWLLLLHVVLAFITIINFPINKFFIGWDTLNPEFSIPLNISRSLFPFWQENYGLGALTGHGFAATLPHTIITWLLSIVLPMWAIRTTFTFLCFYLGGIGMFFLMKYLLTKIIRKVDLYKYIPAIAFISSLFYLLNLGTIQIFFIQLEAFIVQFAALPWLFLAIFKSLDEGKRKNYIFLFLVSLFASIQGFIPSLFMSYFVAFIITLTVFLATNRTKNALKRAAFAFLIGIITNLYWIMPIAYFQLTRGAAFINAYNNLSSTPRFVELSKQFGSIENVALLKSYLFSSFELGGYILQPYISHLNKIFVSGIGYLLFIASFFGILIAAIKIRNYYSYAIAALFIYFLSSIAISTFPFNLFSILLQKISPTYEQAFRTTFTKFGIGNSFLYAIGIGLLLVLTTYFLSKFGKKIYLYLSFSFISLAILFFSLPVFTGNLFYKKLFHTPPPAYFEFMQHMNSAKNGRIADFPQYCTSGWYAYNWGYFGSGFMWYGVKQPFLSRSFDVWNPNNENYYWEISQALNAKDYEKASTVLKKYHVSWVLFDPNIIGCATPKNTDTNRQFTQYLTSKKIFSVEKVFSKGVSSPITLLRNNTLQDKNYLSITTNLPNIGPSTKWIDSDSMDKSYYTNSSDPYDFYFPFRSLLTKRGVKNGSEPNISIRNNEITISTILPKLNGFKLTNNPYFDFEKEIPINITFQKNGENTLNVILKTLLPTVRIADKNITPNISPISIGSIPINDSENIKLFVNGQKIESENENYQAFFTVNTNNIIEITYNNVPIYNWNSDADNAFQKNITTYNTFEELPQNIEGELKITIPFISNQVYFGGQSKNISSLTPTPCNEITQSNRNIYEMSIQKENEFVRLISKNSAQCIKLSFPNLFTEKAYILSVTSKNIEGSLPKTSLFNNGNLIYSDLATGKKKDLATSLYVIPPSSTSEIGYDFEFQNASKTNIIAINDFYDVKLLLLPYNFLKNFNFTNSLATSDPQSFSAVNSTYVNPLLISAFVPKKGILTFAQSYDPGWRAYEIKNSDNNSSFKSFLLNAFPFFFGKEIDNHILVNNWANGWKIDTSSKILIVYLPQYIEYVSYLITILFTIVLFWKSFIGFFQNFTLLNNFFENKAQFFKGRITSRYKNN